MQSNKDQSNEEDIESNPTDTESNSGSDSSYKSTGTIRNSTGLKSLVLPTLVPPSPSKSISAMSNDNSSVEALSPLQLFIQRTTNSLSKFNIKNELTDENYKHWNLVIHESIESLGYESYLDTKDFVDTSLTDEKHKKIKFLITTWILSKCDGINGERARDHLTVRDPITKIMSINYDPHLLWNHFRNYHANISEAKLKRVENALHSLYQLGSDSMRAHIDKFSSLLREYNQYGGHMSTDQEARTLIKSLKPGYEVTIQVIYRVIKPLTLDQVKNELLMAEEEQSYVSPSMIQSSHHANSYHANPSHLTKCTADRCVGNTFQNPHKPEQCFKRPENYAKRDDWMAKQDENKKKFRRRNFNNQQANQAESSNAVRGVKIVRPPLASANHAMTFLIELKLDNTQPEEQVAPIVSEISQVFPAVDVSSAFIHTPVSSDPTTPEDPMPIVLKKEYYYDVTAQGSELIDLNATASAVAPSEGLWALNDTGASHHMFNDISLFDASTVKPLEDSNKRLRLAGGDASLAVHSTGSVKLRAGDGTVFTLADCLYVPELSRNLIAGGALLKKGVVTVINSTDPECFSLVMGQCALFNGAFTGNLMLIALEPVSYTASTHSTTQTSHSCHLQHQRLGHISNKYLNEMVKLGSLDGLCDKSSSVNSCPVCISSKSKRLPFSGSRPRSASFLQNVHVDLSGINRVTGLHNESYYILFTDDFSSFRHIFPLCNKTKETVFLVFTKYIALAERQTGCRLIQFTLDQGSEFINSIMQKLCEDTGIVLHFTASYTPEQNGVAERSNQTITTRARSFMVQSGVPLNFWYEACATAVFVTNRCITTALPDGKTPFEVWFFRKPSVEHLRVFGCQANVLIRKEARSSKFSSLTTEGVLVGFQSDNFNYRVFDLDSRKIILTHNVTFCEDIFLFLEFH